VTRDGPFAQHHENISVHNTSITFRVFSTSSLSGKQPLFSSPSIIFENILESKKTLRIQDFSVKHTTLDEVFVGFAKPTEGEDSEEEGAKEIISGHSTLAYPDIDRDCQLAKAFSPNEHMNSECTRL
jgi:hypothetical protein